MDNYRLKVRVGEHEFEAEGDKEAVQSQFDVWKDLIAAVPTRKDDTPATNGTQEKNETKAEDAPLQLDKIMRAEGRVISLTAPPQTEQEAALLVLLGQRHYRTNEQVTGSEIMDGMTQSGYRLARVDRLMDSLASEGSVIRTGQHRGTRYRLSNTGLARAQGIARETLARVA